MSQVRIGEPSRGKTISGWYRARMRIGMVRVPAVYNRLRRIPKTHFLMAISPAALGTVVQQHNQCAGVYATVLTPREVSVGFVVERGMAESAATEWTPRGVFPIIFYRQGGHTNMAEIQAIATADDAAPVSGVVPMIRVADVLKSAEFYRSLGFEIGNAVPREGPPFQWVWLYQPKTPNWKTGANLMLSAGWQTPGSPVAAEADEAKVKAKVILFYVYARDLKRLRTELISKGIEAGEISYPEYLPEGEFRVQDPDSYALMIAQSGRDTP